MKKLQLLIFAVFVLSSLHLNAQPVQEPASAALQETKQASQPAQTGDKPDDTAEVDSKQESTEKKLPTNAQLKKTLKGLTSDSVVVEIDGQTATWRELYPHIQFFVADLQAGKRQGNQSPVEMIHDTLQKLVARRMFAMEARRLGYLPGDEEKKEVEAEIEESMKSNKDSTFKSLAQFKDALMMKAPNLLNVTYEDILNIMYLNRKLFADIKISDRELDFYIRYKKAVQNGFSGINVQRHEAMMEIAKDPKLHTDEGFKELAKKYSEGVEADWGGELMYEFTREELAEVNELKEFNWKVGEVTPVLETATAFRIMKILRAIPPKTPDEPEKYRAAQILCGKIGEYEDLNNREAIRARLTPQKQKAIIDEYTYQMSKRFNVKTPLFPDGLWQKPEQPMPVPKSVQTAPPAPDAGANTPNETIAPENKE